MTWADFAHAHALLFGTIVFTFLAIVLYIATVIRYAIAARYNLEVAATRTTQEEYLVEILAPVLEDNGTFRLHDPVHRNALARELAKKVVTG